MNTDISIDEDPNEHPFVTKGPPLDYTPEPEGLGYALYNNMARYRNATAQIDGLTGVRDTYEHLLSRCIHTAEEMRRRGLTSEDIVTICSVNHLNSCVPFIAASFLGVKLACLDPSLSVDDVSHLLKLVQPRMAFVGLESLQLMELSLAETQLNIEIVSFGYSPQYTDFRDFVSSGSVKNFELYKCKDLKEVALIYFSSGTTGLPKGICLSHFAIMAQSYVLSTLGYTGDVFLSYATHYWISTGVFTVACTFSGACRVIASNFKVQPLWKMLDDYKINVLLVPPIQAIAIYKSERPEGMDTTHLSDIVICGGPLSVTHLQEIRDIFPGTNVSLCYGQTETAGAVILYFKNKRKHILAMYKKLGSSGTVSVGATCKIVDPETNEILGPNEQGELRVKMLSEMNGYYNMDSSVGWDDDGWLRTGDIAYYDDDRFFYIVDRLKEMLKFRAFHVSPAAIEAVLMTHPSVSTALVIGIPNDEDGDHPLGLVVLKNPDDSVTPEEVEKYVEMRVSDRQKLRGGIKIIDRIPITATGKVKRLDVIKSLREGKI